EADLPFEFMLNALRLLGGVPARRFSETTGLAVESLEPLLTELREEGLMVGDRERLAVTELGRRFLSDVQERFLVVRE
ncbi:MAG TPA: oxygen-independent coproporphyrinogen III oxidase-like protein, partial [Sutterella sp.]|nr:oxygen-independent coproporphyrinogen III oxidase-like protein [Sutterella sp.]